MDANAISTPAGTIRRLQWWMRLVGGFYLLMAAFNTPPIIEARFPMQYPDLRVTVDSAPAQALVDVWFMFGLEVAVIGAALLWSSRDPLRHIALVWVVVGLEVVRGIADDLYLIVRGYDAMIYTAWIVLHLVIAIPGVVLARRALQVERRPVGQ